MFGSEVMFEPKIVYPLAYLSQIYGILGVGLTCLFVVANGSWIGCCWCRRHR